jgi:hypothetical protein
VLEKRIERIKHSNAASVKPERIMKLLGKSSIWRKAPFGNTEGYSKGNQKNSQGF